MTEPAPTIFRCPTCWQTWNETHDCTGETKKEEILQITDDTMITDSAWYL